MASYTTKEFIKKVNISEATLRRWIAEKNRIPELDTAEKDWRGWEQNILDDVYILRQSLITKKIN